MSGPQVMVLGRVCVDLYPTQVNTPLKDVASFTKTIGGSAANLAVAVARYGHDVALVTRTGDDAFGEFQSEQLARYGVDNRFVSSVAGMQSVLTFCEIFPPDNFPIYTYRQPTAPDMYLSVEDLPLSLIRDATVLWSTATGLAREPSRAAHYAAWQARGRTPLTILDLDYRPSFWESEELARREIGPAVDFASIAIGNLQECEIAIGESDPHRAADALLARGVSLAIVKKGPAGVLAKTHDEVVDLPPLAVDVVNGLGAGDAFGGAVVHGLLSGWPLAEIINFANAAGALVATRYECSAAMPTSAEVDDLLAQAAGPR